MAVMGIAEDATAVLLKLAEHEREVPESRETYLDGPSVRRLVNFGSDRLNGAVEMLEENGYIEVLKTFGTEPYNFNSIRLLSRGRFEAERVAVPTEPALPTEGVLRLWNQAFDVARTAPQITRSPQPAGSPFGFTSQDWESVLSDHHDPLRLIVVFGHPQISEFFETNPLRDAVRRSFQRALNKVRPELHREVRLDYRPLAAGYGGHLFNKIARDIIGSDIAVFDTSDLNPNVMIELGVALTWDVRVLPIRHKSATPPPSDISGQTWALYDHDGLEWLNPDHHRDLVDMVRLACRRRPRLS